MNVYISDPLNIKQALVQEEPLEIKINELVHNVVIQDTNNIKVTISEEIDNIIIG